MKPENIKAIQAVAEIFVRRNSDQFAVYDNRWWYLRKNRWTRLGARDEAFRALQECVAFLPTGSDAQQWVIRATGSMATANQILARAGILLRTIGGLPGPGFTPPVDPSER